MGTLYGPDPNGRMSDSTDIEDVDNGVAELERDIGQIFGVPLLTSITGPVFKLSSDLTSSSHNQVQSDGTVDGTLVFSRATATVPDTSPGVIFENRGTSSQYKITCVGSHLGLYQWDTSVVPTGEWVLVANLNEVATSIFNLTEVLETTLDDSDPGDVLVVNPGKTGFEFSPVAGGGGATQLSELTDVQVYSNIDDANKVLSVEAGGTTYWRELGSAAVASINDLSDVYGGIDQEPTVVAADEGKMLVIETPVVGPTQVVFDKVSAGLSTSEFTYSRAAQSEIHTICNMTYGLIRTLHFQDFPGVPETDNYWTHYIGGYAWNHLTFFRDGFYNVILQATISGFAVGRLRFTLSANHPTYCQPIFDQTVSPAIEMVTEGTGVPTEVSAVEQRVQLYGQVNVTGVGNFQKTAATSEFGECAFTILWDGSNLDPPSSALTIKNIQWVVSRIGPAPQ